MKHLLRPLAWLAFAFLYSQGLNLIQTMVNDKNYGLSALLLSFTAFNLLSAHLITRHEKCYPTLCALLVGCVGVVVFGVLIEPLFAHLHYWQWVFIIVSLVIFVWGSEPFAKLMAKKDAVDKPKP